MTYEKPTVVETSVAAMKAFVDMLPSIRQHAAPLTIEQRKRLVSMFAYALGVKK
jgi:hypothetical protein